MSDLSSHCRSELMSLEPVPGPRSRVSFSARCGKYRIQTSV